MREKGKTVKEPHFEKWLVCNIQQLISVRVLKTHFQQAICMPQPCIYACNWDDSLSYLSIGWVANSQPGYVYKLMSGEAQKL